MKGLDFQHFEWPEGETLRGIVYGKLFSRKKTEEVEVLRMSGFGFDVKLDSGEEEFAPYYLLDIIHQDSMTEKEYEDLDCENGALELEVVIPSDGYAVGDKYLAEKQMELAFWDSTMLTANARPYWHFKNNN